MRESIRGYCHQIQRIVRKLTWNIEKCETGLNYWLGVVSCHKHWTWTVERNFTRSCCMLSKFLLQSTQCCDLRNKTVYEQTKMNEEKTSILVISQLFFTVFGSLANIFVFIILRDLPDLSSSTYNVLILNLTATNLIICTIVKPMSSIFISLAFAEVLIRISKS